MKAYAMGDSKQIKAIQALTFQSIKRKFIPLTGVSTSLFAIVIGSLSLFRDYSESLTSYPLPLLSVLCFCVLLLLVHARLYEGSWQLGLAILFGFAFISALIVWILPDLFTAHTFSEDIAPRPDDRASMADVYITLLSSLILLAVAIPTVCSALYRLLGTTPKAHDLSRYPIIILPVVLTFLTYGFLISFIVKEGASNLSWDMITTPYREYWQGDVWTTQLGFRDFILGTLLLIGLTSLISLPVGIGVGLFTSEYGGRLAGVVRMTIAALRALSLFILGITAIILLFYSKDSFLADLIVPQEGVGIKATFIFAAFFLSLLVIPVIARATEEGCRSLPPDLREGSAALGATPGYTLIHLLFPWSLPNIVTGLLIGCAEAAGCIAVIMFIAGTGQYGIGPFEQVTSLPVLIWEASRGADGRLQCMEQYIYSAALLLLIITTSLTIAGLLLKRRFARRYRAT